MKFLDEAKIYIKAGDGGAGLCSFRREKFLEYGGPNGGNGGKGGDVYLVAVPNLNTLIDFRYQQHYKAQNGSRGGSRSCTGASGEDLYIKVPTGTVVLADDRETVLADLDKDNKEFLIAHGGQGGRGNESYKTSTNQAPHQADPGEPGEECTVWLYLKVIANVGLIGLPNAGKSTLLSVVTRARPKIANYPFTTLYPNLGVVSLDDGEFVIADIPGLIEGASEGAGLGLRFLKHTERCQVLVHLIDATESDVVASYKTVRGELKAYGAGLAKKPEVVVLNKIDALTEEDVQAKIALLRRASRKRVCAISGVSGQGLDALKKVLQQLIKKGE